MRFNHLAITAAGSALILILAACAVPPATPTPVLVIRESAAATSAPNLASVTATNAPDLATQESATLEAAFKAQDMFREDNQGAVTVDVTPLNLGEQGNTLDFDIAMNTHSVNLDMDLAALATLETDTDLSVTPTAWDAPRGGHHVRGTLSFPASVGGKSFLADAKKLTLIIREVDAPERVFMWELEN